jgi:hypothetical protein
MQFYVLYDVSGEPSGRVSLDQESFAQESIFCLLISIARARKRLQARHVLVLKHANLEDDQGHRRVGIGEIVREEFSDTLRLFESVIA